MIMARAPVRISFGGGGTDVEPYCSEHDGLTLNATINHYIVGSLEFCKERQEYDELTQAVIQHFLNKNPLVLLGEEHHFKINVYSDIPAGSGLGSSSTYVVMLIKLFMEAFDEKMDDYEIAALAYKIERLDCGMAGGKQDQYATTFGGFNLTEWHEGSPVVIPLKISRNTINDLESKLSLFYVGPREGNMESADIIISQQKGYKDKLVYYDGVKMLANKMKNSLMWGNIESFIQQLTSSWEMKKNLSDKISNTRIDNIYAGALSHGAMGGKLTGAGGGGFMMLASPLERKEAVKEFMVNRAGCYHFPFSFEYKGAQSWKSQ